MPSHIDVGSDPPAACPFCKSVNVIWTHERFGDHFFFCGDCERVWNVRELDERMRRAVIASSRD